MTFAVDSAAEVTDPADVLICVVSDHAYGSQRDALTAVHSLVRLGGVVLLDTGVWERLSTPAEAAAIGMEPDDLLDLAGMVDLAIATGFRPLAIQTAARDEWERFKSGFLADWETWLMR